MPVKTLSALRARFEDGDRPTPQDFIDLIDTLGSISDLAAVAITTAAPVLVVADQTARLAAGPGVDVGQRVKQTNTGSTYVKQQDDGTDPGDWEEIGDSIIQIAEVTGLQDELDRRILNNTDDATTGSIGAVNYHTPNWSINLTDPVNVDVVFPNNAIEFAYRDSNLDISLTDSGLLDIYGQNQTLIIKNTSGSTITVDLVDDAVVFNGEFPISLPSGKMMTLTITAMPVADGDPEGMDPYFFVSYAIEV